MKTPADATLVQAKSEPKECIYARFIPPLDSGDPLEDCALQND